MSNTARPETMLRAIGRKRPVLLAVDVSGSMYPFQAVEEAWTKEFREAGAQVATFDHELHIGNLTMSNYGGGTEYGVIREYVEDLPVHPVVVVLTDGVAGRFEVARPDLWHWALVLPGHSITERLPGTVYTVQETA